jgi:CubicO group peptidase (beta-lactamase class C family)
MMAALVILPMTFALASSAAHAQDRTRAGALIDQKLREAVERKQVPGVVALVTDRKGVVYQGAFGVADVATGRPLAADALFRIASMTKAITSTALALVEQQVHARRSGRSIFPRWRSCRCSTCLMPRPETIIFTSRQSR